MTKKSQTAIVVVLLVLALIFGIAAVVRVMSSPSKRTVTVDSGATTRRVDPHPASAVLGQIDMLRQAVLEADIAESMRASLVAGIDQGHAKMRAVLDDDSLTPQTRDSRLHEVQRNFTSSLHEPDDVRGVVAERAGFIWVELDLLSRRKLLPLMFDKLKMTDAQHQAADAAFMEMSVVLRNEPAGGMPNERSMQAMLVARNKLHALLTAEQRVKLDDALHAEADRRSGGYRLRMGTTSPTRPATTRATTSTLSVRG